MELIQTRLPRFKRHRFRKPTLVLQERDHAIIRLVADFGVVTSDEICALVNGSNQMILRRLQKLYHGGYLDRPRYQQMRGNAKMVYALGQRGAQAVVIETGDPNIIRRDWAERNRQLKAGYLEHALMVSRVRATLTLASRLRGDVVVEQWRQGDELRDDVVVEHADQRERIPVCPDAFFTLRLVDEPEGQNRIRVFLEADRGTMTAKRVFVKMRGYWHYWRNGKQEERYGMKNFLVLTVTRTPERAASLRAIVSELDAPKHRGLRMFLFGSEQAYDLENPVGILNPIWLTAADEGRHSLLE